MSREPGLGAHTVVNQRIWDELAPHHANSEFYDLDSFRAGRSTLTETELAEVGEVNGKRLLHLMCHIGLDTLSWARLGARVTGLDFSAEALRIAERLATETGLEAEWVQSDVLAAADRLDSTYDIVYTSKGVLMWIGDISAWARTCARLLKPGGVFYLLELHPLALALDRGDGGLTLRQGYFHEPEPTIVRKDGSYAVAEPGLTHRESREWSHALGEVVSALIEAGIRIEFLHEFPADSGLPDTEASAALEARLPGSFSIRGVRPAT